jgi:hypothetical protein
MYTEQPTQPPAGLPSGPQFNIGQQVHYQGSLASEYSAQHCRFYVIGYESALRPPGFNGFRSITTNGLELRYIIEVCEGDEDIAVLRRVRPASLAELYTACHTCNMDRHVCGGCGKPVAHPSFCCVDCAVL